MADVPKILEEKVDEEESNERDKVDPIRQSELELKKRYPGLNPKAKGVAQRKISTGGTQYFDSGEYAQASRKDRQKIASNPKPVFNPAQFPRLHGNMGRPLITPQNKKPVTASGLATANVPKVEQ